MNGLRRWQKQCIQKALHHYNKNPHFFCQATPGAGKTRMAAELALRLLEEQKIDFVMCFAPSCQVVEGFRVTFKQVIGRPLNGMIGAVGGAFTYQAMDFLDESFWSLFNKYKIMTIFDEIHHCANGEHGSNVWGEQILQRVQDRAAFTLALSGTPWRSDERAIALARYSSPEGKIICDFRYSLKQAIADKACRSPRLVLLDNSQIQVTETTSEQATTKLFNNIAQTLADTSITYENLLRHDDIVSTLLKYSCNRLNELRKAVPNAGGLAIATDIDHAYQIASTLQSLNESFCVVTSRMVNAQQVINNFRENNCRWIIAVGMISEGTDIPRLQVCCYLSRIRTELHYRQVLGRILRRTGKKDDQAWLFMLAEQKLKTFAKRIAEDLPHDLAVLSETVKSSTEKETHSGSTEKEVLPGSIETDSENQNKTDLINFESNEKLYSINFSQHYRHKLLSCF